MKPLLSSIMNLFIINNGTSSVCTYECIIHVYDDLKINISGNFNKILRFSINFYCYIHHWRKRVLVNIYWFCWFLKKFLIDFNKKKDSGGVRPWSDLQLNYLASKWSVIDFCLDLSHSSAVRVLSQHRFSVILSCKIGFWQHSDNAHNSIN